MNESETLQYLLSHAPLEQFYLFAPKGMDEPMLKFFDQNGRSWIVMEDDSKVVAAAVMFLRRHGVHEFDNAEHMLAFERSKSTSR
jgi:hypothetical protein